MSSSPGVEELAAEGDPQVPGLRNPARYSPETGVLGVMTDMRARAPASPLILDKRFDFSKTYWIVAGIAGADPKVLPPRPRQRRRATTWSTPTRSTRSTTRDPRRLALWLFESWWRPTART
ncbi:hypothetical protein ACRAWD_23585 [Caulobacter segnis]